MRNFSIRSIFDCIRPQQQAAAAPGEEQVESESESTKFSKIPYDIWGHILPQLTPYLEVIEGEPTEKQKSLVTACTEQGEPLLNAYHLLIKQGNDDKMTYELGFARKKPSSTFSFLQSGPNIEYVTEPLNPKGVLYRLLQEDPHLFPILGFADSTTKDRFILKYLYREIEKLGGLTQDPMTQVAKLTATDKNTKEVVAETVNVKQEAHWWYLHHVAYSELEEAKNILQCYPEFLLSKSKGEVVDSTRERSFLSTTGLQLAVWNRDWHMYNMMLECIPEDQAEECKADMRGQLDDLGKNGLEYELDNLKHNGLRIVEADEFADRQAYFEENTERRHAYLLIRDETNKTCALGFCDIDPDTGTKKYVKKDLDVDNPLYQFVFDEQNSGLLQHLEVGSYAFYLETDTLPFLVARDECVLRIARDAIKTLGGKTTFTESSSELDLSAVETELGLFSDNFRAWTPAMRVEQGIVMIDGALRSFSAKMWNWWYSRKLDWGNTGNTSFNCADDGPGMGVDYNGFDVLPLPNGVGRARAPVPICRKQYCTSLAARCGAVRQFLKDFLSSSDAKFQTLKSDLEPSLTNRPVV